MKADEFAKKYLEIFAKNISEVLLKKNRIRKKEDGYLWNIMGNNLIKHYEGDDARIEFDKVDKAGAFEIQYDNGFIMGDEEAIVIDQNHLTAKGIDEAKLIEFYIIGKDFSWCYVVTHALNSCGPFFAFAP